MNTHDIKLPPLPPGCTSYEFPDGGYGEDEMRTYARAAIEADRKRRGEPVAWLDPGTEDVITQTRKIEWERFFGEGGKLKAASYTVPLYAAQPSGQARQDAALDRENLAIGRALNRACQELPRGWSIRIDLERDAGTVYLNDPNGDYSDMEGGELFSDQIAAAIDAARQGQGDAA